MTECEHCFDNYDSKYIAKTNVNVTFARCLVCQEEMEFFEWDWLSKEEITC